MHSSADFVRKVIARMLVIASCVSNFIRKLVVVGMRKTDEDGEARRINSSSSCGSTGKGPLGAEEILNTGVFSMGSSEQVRSLGAALELDWRMWEDRKMYVEDLEKMMKAVEKLFHKARWKELNASSLVKQDESTWRSLASSRAKR